MSDDKYYYANNSQYVSQLAVKVLRDSLSGQISHSSNDNFLRFMPFENIFTIFTEDIRLQKNENWNAQIYFQN